MCVSCFFLCIRVWKETFQSCFHYGFFFQFVVLIACLPCFWNVGGSVSTRKKNHAGTRATCKPHTGMPEPGIEPWTPTLRGELSNRMPTMPLTNYKNIDHDFSCKKKKKTSAHSLWFNFHMGFSRWHNVTWRGSLFKWVVFKYRVHDYSSPLIIGAHDFQMLVFSPAKSLNELRKCL